MASVLLGSRDMPSLSMMCPRYSILDFFVESKPYPFKDLI